VIFPKAYAHLYTLARLGHAVHPRRRIAATCGDAGGVDASSARSGVLCVRPTPCQSAAAQGARARRKPQLFIRRPRQAGRALERW
jgi:hypothetical protein